MAQFEFVDLESEDFFDVVIEVTFDHILGSMETVQVMQTVMNVVTSPFATSLFEGFSRLELHEAKLRIDFRFSKVAQLPDQASDEQEDRSRMKIQFIFYLFAVIDHQYRLADVALPPNFRAFLRLPEELGWTE